MKDIKGWIVKWFVENANADETTLKKDYSVNYFDAGFIDSFTFISLIGELEETFGIEFDNDQFVDREFATIDGLTGIIERLGKKQ